MKPSTNNPNFRFLLLTSVFLLSFGAGMPLSYCRKLVADALGQRRVSVVVLGVNPPARKVQHSPSVEQ
jgi:hypothetical protein